MFIRKNWLPLSVFLIAIVMVGLYVLQTRPEKAPLKIHKTTEVEKPTQPQAPVGETSQGGHFHEDGTWHAGPHEAETPKGQQSSTLTRPDKHVGWSPVAWSNPLMPDVIPEHLKMPPQWVNWDYMSLSEAEDPKTYADVEQRLRSLRDTVIENYNPKRPIEELWPAFIEAERRYKAHSEHAKKYPLSIVSGFRADWYYQGIWNFPEIHEMIRSQGGLKGEWYDVFRVEMGDFDPDWNIFHLHDGRAFRVRDDKNYQFYTDYNDETGDYSSMYSFSLTNPDTAETIHVYPDTMSDTELEQLQGWNFNFNPYTRKPISR